MSPEDSDILSLWDIITDPDTIDPDAEFVVHAVKRGNEWFSYIKYLKCTDGEEYSVLVARGEEIPVKTAAILKAHRLLEGTENKNGN